MTRVYLEVGARKTFACALDWPGWCRAGKAEVLHARLLGIKKTDRPRADVLAAIEAGGSEMVQFVARRTAWHALDHAWEIEDRAGG